MIPRIVAFCESQPGGPLPLTSRSGSVIRVATNVVIASWYIAGTLAPMRNEEEITAAEDELSERVWHERHLVLMAEHPGRPDMEEAERAAKAIREELGERKLGPYTDFEWGELNGKLSALRWVLGDEWDSPVT